MERCHKQFSLPRSCFTGSKLFSIAHRVSGNHPHMNRYPESMNPSLPKLSEAAKLDLCCGPTARPGSPGLAESAQAFTRIELLALLAGLVFVAMIALPVLANTNPGSQRLTCANNLRQIGQAFLMWANDHEERIPPMV